MKNFFLSALFTPICLSIFISVFFIPVLSSPTYSFNYSLSNYQSSKNSFLNSNVNSKFLWPLPKHTTVTSKFGYRKAPTNGAATFHGGIDIAAPEGSKIVSIADGTIYYTGWYGANGYTVIIEHENGYKSTYGHVSPVFIVNVGDVVKKGHIIARVGPKYVEKKSYTNYIDNNGNFTNGATTGPHLHFAVSLNNKKINPEEIFSHYPSFST